VISTFALNSPTGRLTWFVCCHRMARLDGGAEAGDCVKGSLTGSLNVLPLFGSVVTLVLLMGNLVLQGLPSWSPESRLPIRCGWIS
jgi:hypothetical protein